MYKGYRDSIGTLNLPVDPTTMSITLPNGMKIQYPDLQAEAGEMGPEYTYKALRMRKRIYGPMVSENVTQALARIVVSYQMLAIQECRRARDRKMNDGKNRKIAPCGHDDVVVGVPEEAEENAMQMLELSMSRPPSWAPEMPVSCEAGGGKTYGDAK